MANVKIIAVSVTRNEAELLCKASRDELVCPQCQRALKAEIRIGYAVSGIQLYCPDYINCGYREN